MDRRGEGGLGSGGVTHCMPRRGRQSPREFLLPCAASTRRDQQAVQQSQANSRRERNMEGGRENEREREIERMRERMRERKREMAFSQSTRQTEVDACIITIERMHDRVRPRETVQGDVSTCRLLRVEFHHISASFVVSVLILTNGSGSVNCLTHTDVRDMCLAASIFLFCSSLMLASRAAARFAASSASCQRDYGKFVNRASRHRQLSSQAHHVDATVPAVWADLLPRWHCLDSNILGQ